MIERAGLEPTDTVLINGSKGGVGLAAVQLAAAIGCEVVIATGTTERKLSMVRAAGATVTYDFGERPASGLAAEVKRLTDGRGVDVVYDPVGGEIFRQSIRATTWGGRVAVVGFAGGDNSATVAANYTLIKGLTVLGCRAGEAVRRDMADHRLRADALTRLIDAGKLKPVVSHQFDITDTAAAFCCLRDRTVVSRLLHPSDPTRKCSMD